MRKYYVEICYGHLGGQYRYMVKAKDEKAAKRIAIKRHKELGRSMDYSKVFASVRG